MRSRLRPAALLFVVLSIGLGAAAQRPPTEPAEGRVGPGAAMQPEPGLKVFPWGSGGQPYGDPAGLEAHFTPVDDESGVELVFPRGSSSDPPSGKYFYWIEGGWHMSAYAELIIYGGESVTSGATLADAGRVALSPQEKERASGDLVLELIQAEPRAGKILQREIVRRKPVREVGEGLLMPVGKTIGALWDRKKRRYLALSRPFQVESGRTVEISLQRPVGTTDLLVRLQRDRYLRAKTTADIDTVLALQGSGGERPPDAKFETYAGIYAVWYGLAPGLAELRAEANRTYLPPRQLDLAPGKIERLTADLNPGPDLTVELNVPAALRSEPLAVEVRRLPGGEVLTSKPITQRQTFEGLPPVLLEVELKTSLGPFDREADLRSGEDGYVLLEPELITLKGKVYHGEKAHPAKLTFTTNTAARKTVEAKTDEEGAYEAVLLQPARSVSIELAGVRQEPYFDVFWPAIEASRELDFHLPDATFAVRVLDAVTRQGVANASVMFRNVYQAEEPAEKAGGDSRPEGPRPGAAKPDRRERVIVQQVSADEKGLASLPPLRRGSLEIRASAEGYLSMRRPLQAQVIDGRTDQTFEVLLEPVGATARLRLRLPNGAPAAAAEVSLVDSLATGLGLFSGRTDGDGLVELPRAQPGVVLVKHPAAAFLARDWRPGDDEAEVTWDLPMAAERPLALQVKDPSGKEAAPNAELALWIDGHRLSGGSLAWLTGSPPMTDASGYWTGTHLPRGPVAILAWGRGSRSEAMAGRLDSQATAVAFPWPDPVEVRALD